MPTQPPITITDVPTDASTTFGWSAGTYHEIQNTGKRTVRAHEGAAAELGRAAKIPPGGWLGVKLAAGESLWLYIDAGINEAESEIVGWGP